MKIVQIITGSPLFGGAEAHVRDLAIGLRARGHDCIVMVGSPEGLLSEQLRASGVPVMVVPALKKPIHPVWDTISLVQIVSALRTLKPDIVATHNAKAGFVGRIAAKLTGASSFFTPHGLSFLDFRTGGVITLRLLLERVALLFGGRMIAVCEAERKLAIEHLQVPAQVISTIHNGLPDCVIPARRGDLPVVITMIARFEPQKDHLTLLRALSRLKHLDWKLHLAGDGSLLSSAKIWAEEFGLSPRIHFLREYPHTPRLLAESDIFALISKFEAFPISILEAMRAGLPVIATDTGGVSEAVKDGVNGFLVAQEDVNRVAEKLELLITSADLRQKLGAQSRALFRQGFDWRAMLDRTEAVYAEAVREMHFTR